MRVPYCIVLSLGGLLASVSASSTNVLPQCGRYCSIDQYLGPKLSSGASITHPNSAIPRWSDFDPLRPGTVVNVATEQDVLVTVGASIKIKPPICYLYSHDVGPVLHRTQYQLLRSKRRECLGYHLQRRSEQCGHQSPRYPGSHIQ